MQVIIQNSAHDSIDNVFEYLARYSVANAIDTTEGIYEHIYSLEDSPYIGRYISKISDKHFLEIIYKKYRKGYRIIYYISESSNTIYILYVADCKQDFNRILKLNSYFKNFLYI